MTASWRLLPHGAAFVVTLASGLGLTLAAATCSLATLDAYDSGSGGSGSGGSGTGGSKGSSSGTTGDGGPGGAPPDASCAAAAGACVEGAPVGWAGPFAFYEGSPASAPSCPAGFPSVAVDAHEGLGAVSPAQCAACACGAAQGLTCQGNATLHLYTDSSCATPCGSLQVGAQGCGAAVSGGCASAVAFTVSGPTATGTCAPSGGKATSPALSWASAARGCTPPVSARDCPSGQLCAPVPPAPFGPKMCIAQPGDLACPAGAYAQKHSAFAGANDTRGCSPCACGGASATCGTFGLNPGGDCFGPFYFPDAPLPISCHQAPSGGMYSIEYTAGPNSAGACAPSGGQPTGTATPEGPVTICCEP